MSFLLPRFAFLDGFDALAFNDDEVEAEAFVEPLADALVVLVAGNVVAKDDDDDTEDRYLPAALIFSVCFSKGAALSLVLSFTCHGNL